jgi:phosphate acetyltransferase
MEIIDKIRQLAKANKKTIVFPEGEEERIIKAALFLRNNVLLKPILLGNIDQIRKNAHDLNIELGDIEIINPLNSNAYTEYVEKYYELRKHKNIDLEQAKEAITNPLFFGAFLVREGKADGAVAGSINTTGNVLRAAIQVVGLAPEVSIVSSSFLMALKNEKILTFADCAVIPDPDVEELASIAISSANTHKKIVEEEPRIAMLSFSTKGSAQHPSVEKVILATASIQTKEPDLKIDGELQFDAAYLESVGQKKAPGSSVAGSANVFIFPDLNSGNIAYKITQRLAGAEAIGPIIQGLKKPYNDLSRGCSVEDVINVACICSILS